MPDSASTLLLRVRDLDSGTTQTLARRYRGPTVSGWNRSARHASRFAVLIPWEAVVRSRCVAESFDPYLVLGVRRGASRREIDQARRSLAKEFHPDTAGPAGADAMRRVNRAWEMLSGTVADAGAAAHAPGPSSAAHWERPRHPASPTPQGSSSNIGWWVLIIVVVLLAALLISGVISALDGGGAPHSPFVRSNLGD